MSSLLFVLISSSDNGGCHGFSPKLQQHYLKPSSLTAVSALLSTTSDHEAAPPKQQQPQDTPPNLELDTTTGELKCFDNKILLNGLSSSTWSSSSASGSSSSSSLFLHTHYPAPKAEHESRLGDLVTCHRLLASARVTRYWMGPAFGTSAKDIPFDTQFCLVEMEPNGPYALLLPLVDDGFRASLQYDKNSVDVVCRAESGDASVTTTGMVRALYVAVSSHKDDDPFELIQRGFAEVANATGTFRTLKQKMPLPPSVDQFGWCTWDAFYSRVTPEGVLEGVQTLKDLGTPPKTIILDDGWQQTTPKPPELPPAVAAEELTVEDTSIAPNVVVRAVESFYDKYVKRSRDGSKGNRIWKFLSKTVLKASLWNYFDTETDFNRQLAGFNANRKFENTTSGMTLKALVSQLKGDKLGIQNVYCWHALHGYWRGVSEQLGKAEGLNVTNFIPKPSKSMLQLEPQLAWDTVSLFGVGLLSHPDDLKRFYEKLHTPLVQAGVDGVKVDVQSGVSAVGGGIGGGPQIAKLYTNAMEDSVAQRFQARNGASNCINCMCHSTENLYRYYTTAVARASDDFYPNRPDSHTVHLINVAYNSLFLGEICLPDWDMFHSRNDAAGLHAASRAVGGCPVYVSDKPGHHDPDILKKLVLPDGTVLRAKLPGRPTRDCLFVDVAREPVALKIWNQNTYGGVIGAFNVQGVAWNYKTHENEVLEATPPPVVAKVKPYDIETLRNEPGPFVAWSHRAESLTFLPSGESLLIQTTLDHRDYDIHTIVPVQSVSIAATNSDSDILLWAPIGLVNMFNSGGAILGAPAPQRISETTLMARVSCRGPGRFVAFTNRAPSKVVLEESGLNLEFAYDQDKSELSITLPHETNSLAHLINVEWEEKEES